MLCIKLLFLFDIFDIVCCRITREKLEIILLLANYSTQLCTKKLGICLYLQGTGNNEKYFCLSIPLSFVNGVRGVFSVIAEVMYRPGSDMAPSGCFS